MALLENLGPRPLYEQIDAVHQAIHLRGMYTISRTALGVANNGYHDIHVIPPAGYEAHLRFVIVTEGKAYLKSYTGTTYTNAGTAITPFNRATNGDASTLLAYHTPTINVLGTPRGDDMIPGGTGGNATGGNISGEFESIIAAGTDQLFRVQNVKGTAGDINIILNYYLRKQL